MYKRYKHIHLVGIGGRGMSGIAELLINQGYKVSGSDLKESPVTQRLRSLGGIIEIGHRKTNVGQADVVVTSSAIKADNPEVVEAKEKRIPVIRRAEMLAELMRRKYGIAVAGAHGKTTCSTMVGSVLAHGKLDPTQIIGGRLSALGSANARLGEGEFLVAEADESDGSFLSLTPTIAVVTNIDEEHLDYYGDIDHIESAFLNFLNKVPFYGLDVICLDDPLIRNLLPNLQKRYITYGTSADAQLRAVNQKIEGTKVSFEVEFKGENLGRVILPAPGKHNVLNALAAVGVGLELEIEFERIVEGLSAMGTIERRFQLRGEVDGITVLDDYAHHPTEIRAVMETLTSHWPDKRLVVAFQPHRYSRTDALIESFGKAFHGAEKLFILPIYAAGEKPGRYTAEEMSEEVKRQGHKDVTYVDGFDEAVKVLNEILKPGDILVTLGAGDIWKIGPNFIEARTK